MCLAIPAKVVRLEDEGLAVVDLHGASLRVCTALAPDTEAGEWVLVHAGFVIQRLAEAEVAEIWEALGQSDPSERGEGSAAAAN